MVFVKVRDNESIEEALRRFKRECERNGILKEIKRREHYLTPSVKRKLKQQELCARLKLAQGPGNELKLNDLLVEFQSLSREGV